MTGRPLHSPIFPTFCSQEDTRAQRQRLQKHLAEHLRQIWGRLGPPPQARDLGELLQAWGAGTRTGTPKGSRFTHSEKFTFHLVGGPEWTWDVLMRLRLAQWVAFYNTNTTLHPHRYLGFHQECLVTTWAGTWKRSTGFLRTSVQKGWRGGNHVRVEGCSLCQLQPSPGSFL